MANLSQDMRNKIDYFERNFNVTTIIFKKYRPIFLEVFKDPTANPAKQSKSRKQKGRLLVSSNDIFTFCWTLFIQVKSSFSEISADLVNSYHLLIACIDFCYNNVLFTEYAKDVLNPNFSELPENFQDDYSMPENATCIISALCEKFQGIQVDAKGIKEHWWKPYIKRLVEKKILKCRNVDQLLGFLDTGTFEQNQKLITKEYETFVLSIGDFDERIFLYDNAQSEIGTGDAADSNHLSAQLNQLKNHIEERRTLAPCTPLSNRHYLTNRGDLGSMTPVSNATQTVSRLQSLLIGFKDQPSANLLTLFDKCTENPTAAIKKRVLKMSDCFLAAYTADATDADSGALSAQQSQDFAKKRLQFAVTFYYKMLENIATHEMKNNADALTNVLSNEMFHVSLFACSVEIVLFAYKSQKVFPWIIETLKDFSGLHFQPADFYKVIELIIRDEEGLSRDIVKHLTSLEERILESMAWRSESSLWEKIKAQGTIPAFQEVALTGAGPQDPPSTPISAVKRANASQSAQDRFNSPINSSIRRRLFDATPNGENSTPASSASNSNAQQQSTPQQSIVQLTLPAGQIDQQGAVYYIINKQQMQQINSSQAPAAAAPATADDKEQPASSAAPSKPNKVGALGLFFRKVYYLAWIRLKDLCERLKIVEEDLLRKIWTCFEYALRNNVHLMRDRHLDQIIMCTIYSMCKITKRAVTFHEIMAEYRFQPHYQSHVYRSILLSNRKDADAGTKPSQPATPNKNGSVDYEAERGDIIMFYNQIYVAEMKKYIVKFSVENSSPPLSPLPRKTPNPISPFRKVSVSHPVFVSPLKSTNLTISPTKKHSTYCFSISPANDLKAINQMVKSNQSANNGTNTFSGILSNSNNGKKISKRIFMDHESGDYSPTKRICSSINLLSSKLGSVFTEREVEANDSDDDGEMD